MSPFSLECNLTTTFLSTYGPRFSNIKVYALACDWFDGDSEDASSYVVGLPFGAPPKNKRAELVVLANSILERCCSRAYIKSAV